MKLGLFVYPVVFTQLASTRCVVVGGGRVAERKVAELVAGGARPDVISPTLTATLEQWRDQARIVHTPRMYEDGSLAGAFLVIAATNDRAVNAAVAQEARREHALINVIDDPDTSTFHTPATVRRGELLLTVSTNGASPTLAARIRRELAERYGEEYAPLLRLLRDARRRAQHQLAPPQRARFWQALDTDRVLGWLRRGEQTRAETYISETLTQVEREH